MFVLPGVTVAEIVGLRAAVTEFRNAIELLNKNTDPAAEKLIRNNAKDARTSLERCLRQLSKATAESQVSFSHLPALTTYCLPS